MQHKERRDRQESQGYVNSTYIDLNNKNNLAYNTTRMNRQAKV